MGFSWESTYNQLCGRKDNDSDHTSCATPTYWEMPKEVDMEMKRERKVTPSTKSEKRKSEL